MNGRSVRGSVAGHERTAVRDVELPATGFRVGGVGHGSKNGRRQRSWGLVTVAALCVLGTGLAVAAWGLRAGEKDLVLAVGEPVSKGQPISRGDLVTASVSGVSGAILASDIASVLKQTAAVDLVGGQVLTPQMLAATPLPAAGQATVGLALDPARVPGAGLAPGDVVDAIAVPGPDTALKDPGALDSPEVLASGASVYEVEDAATAGGLVLVTLLVDADDAARISAYSTQNRVAIVETAPPDAEFGAE